MLGQPLGTACRLREFGPRWASPSRKTSLRFR